ncbi:MAG: hypothetical protein QXD10_09855 [Metallosphaera sp.]|uniref:hypothetical protein n=1 Tax=Metallosphaera sp. TaxID=2020860 RepID=UPI00316A7EFF
MSAVEESKDFVDFAVEVACNLKRCFNRSVIELILNNVERNGDLTLFEILIIWATGKSRQCGPNSKGIGAVRSLVKKLEEIKGKVNVKEFVRDVKWAYQGMSQCYNIDSVESLVEATVGLETSKNINKK